MKNVAVVAQWAGDFEVARDEYDRLFSESLERGDLVEARLLLRAEVICQLLSERTEGQPLEVLRDLVKEISRKKEVQIKEQFSGPERSVEDLIKEASKIGEEVTQAVKGLMPYPHEDKNRAEEDRAGTPLRRSSGERRIIVFAIPGGLESRSYHPGDITVNLEATSKQLAAGGGGAVTAHTDRMLEVQVLGEVVEIFADGRIRCISEQRNQTAVGIAKLVEDVAARLVLRYENSEAK